jgi:hypothetical protein
MEQGQPVDERCLAMWHETLADFDCSMNMGTPVFASVVSLTPAPGLWFAGIVSPVHAPLLYAVRVYMARTQPPAQGCSCTVLQLPAAAMLAKQCHVA